MFKGHIAEFGLILIAMIWGSGFVGTQLALDGGLTPLQLLTIRFFIGAVLINLIFFKQIKENINKEILKSGVILGFFLFIAFAVQTIGILYTTPTKNAFITAANVVIVPFIGFFIYKRKLDKFGIISSIMTLIGIGILSLEADFSINIGDFLTLICAFGFAFHIFFTSEFASKYNPIILTGIQFTVAFILSLVCQIFMGEMKIEAQINGYLGALYLGVFSTTIAFLLQTICQKMVDGTKTAIILSTEAVFGTIFSVLILKEIVTLKMLIGIAIIFTSIIMAETKLSFIKKKDVYVEDMCSAIVKESENEL
ncbi:DMT family transporter [Romboutsia lituseburensis]|uniref:Permease of the drug/metabolite transporter (DMT) superfamily n=2 Tax=root TaxID=1 RepID=A0A1G9KFM8_9FIRM|nr:DMT family transporter [Romboutsia lituseburensis]CEH34886.1 DMT super drug/metabolite transporter [Romboutsia lituseburensis]SDL48386.1 Permease of the drug/metabolite transporter (DMT) superfamily [Romboutsia lituseburensis DSM 797]